MHWYLEALRKYAVFGGRARRREYWLLHLLAVLITIALVFVDSYMASVRPEMAVPLLTGVFWLAMIIPSISVSARRLHDTNRRSWWILLAFLPPLNLILLVFMFLDGTAGDNDYGPDPKGSQD